MKKLLTLGCLFVVFMGVAALATADTITTSSCNVDFAVNDSGSFYVRSSQIAPAGSPPGLEASSSLSGSVFDLTANSTGYSDAGIVLYFNGSLTLGDLKSASVVSAGSAVSINLWLDTGGDGTFFAFDGNGLMTGLNSDSYGSHGGASLDASSSIYMMSGNGAGQTYTLAQLQAGVVPGINSATPVALWIGLTNDGSANISSVAIWTAAENALQTGGERLAATQNADGGWGWPLTGTSQQNTIGPIAMGLAKAYSHTGGANQLTALEKAGTFLLAKTNTFSPPDGYLAAELDRILGGNTYRNHVMTNYYNQLAAGTYNRNGAGILYDTAGYVTSIRNSRVSQGIPNLAAWDLGMGLVAASACGADTSEWIAGVEAEINELDGDLQYDVIGLAGAVYGLAFVHEEFDPVAGEHAGASGVSDLAAVLAGYQINNGGFADSKNNVAPGNEAIQETGYAMLALNEVNRSSYLNNIQGASHFLISIQMPTGGWGGESGGDPVAENNEVTGEALWGISTAYTPTDNTCTHYTVTPSAGPNGAIDPAIAQTVSVNATPSFTIAPDANYHAVMSGTCGGTLVGSTYTTNPVTADCTVDATFALDTHTVTSSQGLNGSISPLGQQAVSHNATSAFTVSADAGYLAMMSGTCGGNLVGSTYTTNPVTADCSVVASFVAVEPLTITTSSLPAGTVLIAYSQTLIATGGVLPYEWSVSGGALPDGLTINSTTGEISGTPTVSGTFSFTAQVTDATLSTSARNLSIATEALAIRYGIPGGPINFDQIIQSAYDHCADGYIIQIQDLIFTEDFICDRPVIVTLQGGFDEGYTDNPYFTTIQGKLLITDGTVIVENIVIQ